MKKVFLCFLAVIVLLQAGCSKADPSDNALKNSQLQTNSQEKVKGERISVEDADPNGGADSYAGGGDNAKSRYYINPDFYTMKSDENLTIIENFKTMQQTAEWSCGNATAIMVLNHFGKTGLNEMSLAKIMGSSTDKDTPNAQPSSADNFYEYGTNLEQMYNYFSSLEGFKVVETSYRKNYTKDDLISEADGFTPGDYGNLKPYFSSMSLYTSQNDDSSQAWVENAQDSYFVKWVKGHLNEGRPIMVEWGDWDGHWQSIIGYDSNGTPSIGDDILIFADSYDTSDHWQDGYYYYPLERWFYMWKDRNIAPKPYQIQPFIIIDKAD